MKFKINQGYILSILAFLLVLLNSCESPEEKLVSISISSNGRGKIRVEYFAFDIQKDLRVYYLGGKGLKEKGCLLGSVTKSDWKKLEIYSLKVLEKFEDTVFNVSSSEDIYFDLRIKTNFRNVYMIGYFRSTPYEIKDLIKVMNPIMRKQHFRKSKCHEFTVKAFLDKVH